MDRYRNKRKQKKKERKERREERRENMKEFFTEKIPDAVGTIFQPIENIVDTVWQGETDKEKKDRETYNNQVYAEEAAKAEQTKQMIFDWSVYIGIGGLAVLAIYIVFK